MRIRTDGEYAHREDTIEAAADYLDCNKTRAVVVSCDVVGRLLDNLAVALEHENISPQVRSELAETISTRIVQVKVSKPQVAFNFD